MSEWSAFFSMEVFSEIFLGKLRKKDLRRWSQHAPSPFPSIRSLGQKSEMTSEGGEGSVLSADSSNIEKYSGKLLTEGWPKFLLKLFP